MATLIAMPDIGVAKTEFNIVEVDAINTLMSGAVIADGIAPAYWEASITTTGLARRSTRLSEWTAFLDSLRGAKRVALLYDADAPCPQAYANLNGLTRYIGGSFDGTGDVDSRINNRQFQISGLPANFALTKGDYFGLVRSGRYFLTRLSASTTASSLGVATVSVEPSVPAYFTAAATYNVLKPYGEFLVQVGSISRPRSVEDNGTISFRAKSRLF